MHDLTGIAAVIAACGSIIVPIALAFIQRRWHVKHDEVAEKTLAHVTKHLTNGRG